MIYENWLKDYENYFVGLSTYFSSGIVSGMLTPDGIGMPIWYINALKKENISLYAPAVVISKINAGEEIEGTVSLRELRNMEKLIRLSLRNI